MVSDFFLSASSLRFFRFSSLSTSSDAFPNSEINRRIVPKKSLLAISESSPKNSNKSRYFSFTVSVSMTACSISARAVETNFSIDVRPVRCSTLLY